MRLWLIQELKTHVYMYILPTAMHMHELKTHVYILPTAMHMHELKTHV